MISEVTCDWLEQISFETCHSACSSLASKNIKIIAFMLIFKIYYIKERSLFNDLKIFIN